MRSYQDVLKELRAAGINGVEGIPYDYVGFPNEELFEMFFNFCQEYLDRTDHPFNINPARMYYSTATDINACAYKQNGLFLVEINKGTIFKLLWFFTDKSAAFQDHTFEQYNEVCQRKQIEPVYLLFQFVTLFFIYHETGHLVQRIQSTFQEPEFLAKRCTDALEIKEQQARELDADWFAATPLAMHIIQFGNHDRNDIEALAAIAIAGIYCFFISHAKGYQGIYYREECHPHPSVRLSYMIVFTLDALKHNLQIDIDQPKILHNATVLAEKLMLDVAKNIVVQYTMELYDNLGQIEAYVNDILGDRATFPYMCGNILVP